MKYREQLYRVLETRAQEHLHLSSSDLFLIGILKLMDWRSPLSSWRLSFREFQRELGLRGSIWEEWTDVLTRAAEVTQRVADGFMALKKSTDDLLQQMLERITSEERARYDALVADGECTLDALDIATEFPFQQSRQS